MRPDLDAARLDELTHAGVRSYLRYWAESFRLPSWPTDDLVRRTRVVGEDTVRAAHAEGRGVVAALPHMANWDWAGAWACATGMPLTTVAERLRPERLYDEFVAYRRSLGMEILPLTGGDPALPQLEDHLAAGRMVVNAAEGSANSLWEWRAQLSNQAISEHTDLAVQRLVKQRRPVTVTETVPSATPDQFELETNLDHSFSISFT